jgi:hypothetical protein
MQFAWGGAQAGNSSNRVRLTDESDPISGFLVVATWTVSCLQADTALAPPDAIRITASVTTCCLSNSLPRFSQGLVSTSLSAYSLSQTSFAAVVSTSTSFSFPFVLLVFPRPAYLLSCKMSSM